MQQMQQSVADQRAAEMEGQNHEEEHAEACQQNQMMMMMGLAMSPQSTRQCQHRCPRDYLDNDDDVDLSPSSGDNEE